MNQEDSFAKNIQDDKPLNINISFNINRKQVTQNLMSNQRQKKHQQDKTNKKSNENSQRLNSNQHIYKAPKTPQLSMTDRNVYSKQIQYLRPTEQLKRKKKVKRNSADYTVSHINQTQGFIGQVDHFSYQKRGNTSTLIKRGGPYKSKRTNSKLQGDTSKQSNIQKSVDYSNAQIKGPIQKSLKSMINKIIKSELSKRSLPSSSINKTKTNISNSLTSRKKPLKKKSKQSFSKQLPQKSQVFHRKEIIQKLGSLRSVQNSVMVSEVNQQDQFKRSRRTIVIKTDNSMECLDQIHNFERNRYKQDFFQQDSKNITQTQRLIQNYVKLFSESQFVQNNEPIQLNGINDLNMEQSQNYLKQSDYSKIQNLLKDSIKQEGQSPIRKIQKNKQRLSFDRIQQMVDTSSEEGIQIEENQFSQQSEKLQNLQYRISSKDIQIQIKKDASNAHSQKKPKSFDYNEQENQILKPFISSQMGRGQASNNNQRIKLNQLKKQEIQKWGYLLQFIKSNMGKGKTNTQDILTQVYSFLEKAKVDLQKQVAGDPKDFKNNDHKQFQEFTVKLSSQFERSQAQNQESKDLEVQQQSQQCQNQLEVDQDVLSFKQQYEEQNQAFKMMNLETIQQALKNRFNHLNERKAKQLLHLQQKKQSGKINNQQFLLEKQKVQKWIKKQTDQILKAKKNIWKGYNEAKGILDKTANSKYFQEYQTSNTKKMMKCLSQSYLNKKSIDYKKILQKKKQQQSSEQQEQQQDNQSSEADGEQQYNLDDDIGSLNSASLKSQQAIDKINEKVIRMKERAQKQKLEEQSQNQYIQDYHMEIQQQKNINLSPCVSYEQVQKQLNSQQYSDEEYKLINQEIKFNSSRPPVIQKSNNKFKYLTSQDKQDIFQFLFLDLCIQLYQQPCKQNKFMEAINNYIEKLKVQGKKKKGVKTNLNVVKDYLKRFCGFILRTNKDSLQNLNVPMGPTAIQMLRYMHQNDFEDDYRQDDQGLVTLIVPMLSFDKFQKTLLPTLQFQKYYDDQQKQNQRIQFLKNILHIHNKALYDALNQYLDQQRPFGIWGKPFPWKKSSSFPRNFTQLQLQQKLKKSAEKVVETCSYVCGLLVDKQQSLVGNAKLSQAYIQQIKQDRISRMLANDMIQNQQRWVFYDDQQTQVLVQTGNTIFNRIIMQVCMQVQLLKRRQIQQILAYN